MFDGAEGCRDSRGSGYSINRRDFLKRTGALTLGVGAALGANWKSAHAEEKKLTVNGLPATVLGRTGLIVTRISLGGILITEPPVLLRAIERGINFIHTAPGYQNGRSIEAFGKVMKTHREKVIIALKVRPEDLDSALKILNTDYVDILVPPLHSLGAINDPTIPENFEKAKKAGKCGFMGFACHSHMAAVLNRARELGYFDVALMSYADTGNAAFVEAAKKANQAGMGIMAMKGLPKRSSRLDPEKVALVSSLCTSMLERYYAHTVLVSIGSFQAVEAYREILETKLGYCDPGLEERYWAQQQGNYCAMCGNCTGVCPQGVEISRVVRYRMYHKDYALTDYAKVKYAAMKNRVDPAECESCDLCERVCSRRLPLREILTEAHALLA